MSQTDSQEPARDDVKKLFQEVFPIIPAVVRQACASLRHYPDQTEIDSFAQRIRFLLWDDDYRVLRSFKGRSSPETWLFRIAKRNIQRWLRERDKFESLEHLPPDFLIVHPKLEEWLLSKERKELLQAAIRKLTKHDQKLFGLWHQRWSIGEIATEMKIKKRSVSREINAVIKRLQEIIRKERAI